MSYILDALKKADSERERSAVPGLNAQADGFGIDERRGGVPWRALALGALVLLIAPVVWLWFGRGEAPTAPVAAPAPAPVPLAEATPQPMPPPAMPAPAPAPAPTPAPAPAPSPPPMAAPAPAPPTAMAKPAPRPPAAARPAPAPAPAPAPEARLPTREQLPAELRAALPPLNVGGAVYAPQPANRMLFVNGLVLREGDAVADGVTLERIGPSASVFSARGTRFELKH